jgi:hypothetical protein
MDNSKFRNPLLIPAKKKKAGPHKNKKDKRKSNKKSKEVNE